MKHFIVFDQLQAKEMLKGAGAAFLQTEHLTVGYTHMKAGSEIPLHHHAEEAIDIVLEGEMEMQIGDVTDTVRRGGMTYVPSNVPHKAKASTDCKVVTVFYPKRDI
jgi:quercetin dioxygenase-like cupin family protein